MADEFIRSTNWWDSSRTRFETGGSSSSSSPQLNTSLTSLASFESASVSDSCAVLIDTQKLQSTHAICWNQPLLRNRYKHESSSPSMLQENMNSSSDYQQARLLTGSENIEQQPSSFENRANHGANYCINSSEPWPRVPQFLRNSSLHNSNLHFSNNTLFCNDVRPSFFDSMQPQLSTLNFEEKPKIISQVQESSSTRTVKKSERATKRPRNETPSPLPPTNKVRKEKMGDRITALQQLVSPFGKTDTSSVLSEAIEYIKNLHEQVIVLSTPYTKSGGSINQQRGSHKSKDSEGQKQADLRSRGLCLVPVSSTFPVTHETTADFWTATFGAIIR